MLQQIYKLFDTNNDNLTAVRESYFIIIKVFYRICL